MKCDVCKEAEATVHLTQIISGTMQKVDLCESCAKAKGVSDPTSFSLADMFMGLGHSESAPGSTGAGLAIADLKCPACGMSQADFKKSGRLGCSQCYETFSEGLAPLLKSIHKGEQHVGKAPPGYSDYSFAEQLKQLRKDLDEAVKSENFEVAADLRDKIKKLELQKREH